MASTSRKELARALMPIINKTSDKSKLAKAIARHLTETRRTKELDGLMRDVAALREDSGIVEVTVTSAFPLNNDLKRDVRSLISKERQATNVVINEVIDPDVLGGLRLETGEQQLDVTVQAKLLALKRAIV